MIQRALQIAERNVRVDRQSDARPRAAFLATARDLSGDYARSVWRCRATMRDLPGDERFADRKGGADELTERVVAPGFEGKRDGVELADVDVAPGSVHLLPNVMIGSIGTICAYGALIRVRK